MSSKYTQRDSKVGNFAKLGASGLRPLKQPIFSMNMGDGNGLKDEDAKAGKKPTVESRCVHGPRRKIFLLVGSIHLIVLGIVFCASPFQRTDPKKKRLVVQTIVQTPVKQTATVAPKRAPAPSKPAVKKVDTTPSKPAPEKADAAPKPKPNLKKVVPPVKKAVVAAKAKTPSEPEKPKHSSPSPAKPKSSPPVATPRREVSESLARELQERINELSAAPGATTSVQTVARPIQLQIDSLFFDAEMGDYTDELITTFRNALNLPEFGEVKVQLTLRRDGSLAKLVVVKSENQNNLRYLEEHLPHLRFPPFDRSFAHEKEHVFALTFCNDM